VPQKLKNISTQYISIGGTGAPARRSWLAAAVCKRRAASPPLNSHNFFISKPKCVNKKEKYVLQVGDAERKHRGPGRFAIMFVHDFTALLQHGVQRTAGHLNYQL
jgi:hypothetical protein